MEDLKKLIEQRLAALQATFARAAIGDFSQNVDMYEEEDEFTETFAGVQIMLEVIRAQLGEMRELNQQMEHKVDELRQEVALRKELERRKDEFITILGHELRNPLAPIMYAAQLIKTKVANDGDSELRENASIIERQSEQLARLIKDLLDASRILHGKIEIEPHPQSVALIIENSIEAARPSLVEKKHKVSIDLPDEPIVVSADSLRLEQILVNLLNNAARYTPQGGSIVVSADNDGTYGYIRVKDSGIGISKELLDRIFDIFVQSRNSGGREGGLGLGLMIARGLAQLHGGDLLVQSEGVGRGSEFTVQLPLSQAVLTAKHTDTQLEKPFVQGQLRRVLVIDDNSDLANTVAGMLRRYGHEVRIAYDGETGINIAQTFKPETVFLDLAMPDMDGFAVAKHLKNEHTSSARIVALTGFGQKADFEKTRAAGFDGHLVKPPALNALLEALG
jgi:signal transduction histidine kinase